MDAVVRLLGGHLVSFEDLKYTASSLYQEEGSAEVR